MYQDKPRIKDVLANAIANDSLYLEHYGVGHDKGGNSGRYPWGSGDAPFQNSDDFYSRMKTLKKEGITEKEICEMYGLSTTKYRSYYSLAKDQWKTNERTRIKTLREEGKTYTEIAKIMGYPSESTVRSKMNAESIARASIATATANSLKDVVDAKGMIDIGEGTETSLRISKEKMKEAVEILKGEGYEVYNASVPQATNPGRFTKTKILCPPGTEYKETYDYSKINSLEDYISRDGDTLETKFHYPESMDSKRLKIRYSEEGGTEKDGLIEIRRNVPDLSLGDSVYSQVRVLVDNKYYLKGMAAYGNDEDFPEGVDVIFNSNKSSSVGMDALKSIKKNLEKDPTNPFGSAIKDNGGQSYWTDENGESHLSLINKRADEGDWGDWANKLPSQFLSKQSLKLIKQQLKLSGDVKQDELNEIMELNNPTIKRTLLEKFANECDSQTEQLYAASLPGQAYKVIIPVPSLSDKEIFAPGYSDGETLALVRYPHGGTFEIPIVTVNNRNKEALDRLTNTPVDAVGINKNVADRLSGADFDGDTVMVLPLSKNPDIVSTKRLQGLIGFDTKLEYGPDKKVEDPDGTEHYYRAGKEIKIMTNTQMEMGKISNLITDMTIQGASPDELARAVRHSMVVIDAEKHHLDYKTSESDNKIDELKRLYQTKLDEYGNPTSRYGGASTLISLAKSEVREIPERKDGAYFTKDGNKLVKLVSGSEDKKNGNPIYADENGEVYDRNQLTIKYTDPKTGEKLYRDTGRIYYKVKDPDTKKEVSAYQRDGEFYYKNSKGEQVKVTNEFVRQKRATISTTQMLNTSDARTLSTGTEREEYYADFANRLKSLANTARKEALMTKDIPYSRSAENEYAEEVKKLKADLNLAKLNAPKERLAQLMTAGIMKSKKQQNPEMTKEEELKYSTRELNRARTLVGAKRTPIKITEKGWEAIQKGALSAENLRRILANMDDKDIKTLATPHKDRSILSAGKQQRIQNMARMGYTTSEIAYTLGVSSSTISKYIYKGR